eukprot:scaffold147829_cov30-Tisochrysis_lutea.AAC.5
MKGTGRGGRGRGRSGREDRSITRTLPHTVLVVAAGLLRILMTSPRTAAEHHTIFQCRET